MTDNCKPKFTFNDKLPPMTKKMEVTDKVIETKEPIVINQKKKRKRKRKNRKDAKWKAVERNYLLPLMIVDVKKGFVVYIQTQKVITAHLITKPFIEKI